MGRVRLADVEHVLLPTEEVLVPLRAHQEGPAQAAGGAPGAGLQSGPILVGGLSLILLTTY